MTTCKPFAYRRYPIDAPKENGIFLNFSNSKKFDNFFK